MEFESIPPHSFLDLHIIFYVQCSKIQNPQQFLKFVFLLLYYAYINHFRNFVVIYNLDLPGNTFLYFSLMIKRRKLLKTLSRIIRLMCRSYLKILKIFK